MGDAPEPPKQTFSENVWRIEDRSRLIEVRYLGAAHTRDDVIVYLPREQALCSGDVAIHSNVNSFMDSDFANWPAVLQEAPRLRIKRVLPGHGEVGGKEILERQGQFLTILREKAVSGLARGQKPAEIAASIEFPENLHPWVGPSLARQVSQVCDLMRPKGAARPD